MKSTKSDDPATIGNLYGTAAATAAVFIPRLISYLFLSRASCDSVPPPMSSWYVSPIWVPLSTSKDKRFLWRMVEPIWSITSSPTTSAPFFLNLACHTLLEAIFAGVALMNALPASSAAWAYISLAFDAPVGVRLTNTSALVSSRTLEMLEGFALLGCILSPAIGDIPSRGWAIWTLTPVGRT